MPLGAIMIIVVELVLLALYLKAGELVGMVRVLAAVYGCGADPAERGGGIDRELCGGCAVSGGESDGHVVSRGANLLYALFGEGRRRR